MLYYLKSKKIFYVGLFFLFGTTLSFANSIFNNFGFKITEINQSEITVTYEIPNFKIDSIYDLENHLYFLPKIFGSNISQNNKRVELYSSLNFTVPYPSGAEVIDFNVDKQIVLNVPIAKINLIKDYARDELLSKENNNFVLTTGIDYKLKYLGISAGRHVSELIFKTAWGDEQHTVVPVKISFKVRFKEKMDLTSEILDETPEITINHNYSKNWIIKNRSFREVINKHEGLQSDNNKWVKIKITKEGIYSITTNDLKDIGVTIPSDQINTIKIYGKGGKELPEKINDSTLNELTEQPIIIKTKNDGSLDKIIFYGASTVGFKQKWDNSFEHYINHYGDDNYYFLIWGGKASKQFAPLNNSEGIVENRPTTYTRLIFFEEEMHNAFDGGSGRQWFGRNLLPATFTDILHNLDRSQNILYRFAVAHKSSYWGNFTIKQNNNKISEISLNPVSGYYDASRSFSDVILSSSSISNDNRSILQFEYLNNSGLSSALGYIDWYEIQYPAFFTAIDNEISFFADVTKPGLTEYSVNGFNGSEIYGFDITDPENPQLLTNMSQTGGIFIFRANIEVDKSRKYFISSKLVKPASMNLINFRNLRGDLSNAEMVLITHEDLLESAEYYKEYREKQSNIKVDIVTVQDIYNEFSSGIPDPTAVRDYIEYIYHTWNKKPKYIMLWGDGHYDYKNISTKAPNFVPTYQTLDDFTLFYEVNSYTTDDYFVCVDGDDQLIDIPIGRMPVYSNTSGKDLVDKIAYYENNSSKDAWRTNMLILADDSWTTENKDRTLHTAQAENLSNKILPNYIILNKIYLPEYPVENVSGGRRKPAVTQDLISKVNTEGNVLLCYIGHGNPRVWTHEEVFERSTTIPQLRNLDKLFFLTAASCDFGRFDMTDIRSGSEELILSTIGGAIGTFSSTRLVYSEPNAELNEQFYQFIFERNPETGLRYSLGEISFLTKLIRHNENDRKYCLLGDPSVKLLIPDYKLEISSINGIETDNNDTIDLKSLQKIAVEGYVSYPWSEEIDSNFNGTVILNVFDSDKIMEVFDDDGSPYGTIHHYTKKGGALNRSSYEVINGKFKAEFIIPKDISLSNGTGRLYAYAYSKDDKFACGNFNNFIITGIDEINHSDKTGPEIKIYFDSKQFQEGDLVNCTPLLIVELSDESGINSTGLGLGHRIEAWIDDSPVPIDLTDKFSSSLENPNSGTVQQLLFDLKPALHKIKVRAWDVFNNYSIAETHFRISECNDLQIWNFLAYPDPMESTTLFKFNHNLTPPFDYKLSIYNQAGQYVKTLNGTINTLHSGEIFWDGFDSQGNVVPIGSYFIIMEAINNDGIKIKGNSNFVIIR